MMNVVSDDRPTEDNTADRAVPLPDDAQSPTGEPAPAAAPTDDVAPLATDGRPRRLKSLLLVAVVLYGLDLLTKTIVVANLTPGEPVSIIGDFARFTLVRNPGAAFSMATGMTWLLTLVAAAVVIGVIRIGRTLRSPWWAIGLGMVLGGALGNLTDRLFRAPGPLQGHVVDFVAVGWWPVFNVADSAIVCGAILLVVLTVFGFEPDGTRTGRDSVDGGTDEAKPDDRTITNDSNDSGDTASDRPPTEGSAGASGAKSAGQENAA
ncbi:signal peptidase II [Nocardia sp. NBC_01377]|uniref:signal peptidase II n=1 Tax=Nocardia sp. NBC_01377 TaxID=2903595 RepID=UPI003245589D